MPHTKQQIVQLLEQHGFSPRHQWGQNFLIDLNLMRLLVDNANLQGNEIVLEVGHGTGSLTDLLAEKCGEVVAVDIDRGLSQIAQEALSHHRNIHYFCCDVLASKSSIQPAILDKLFEIRQRRQGPLLLVANLPYQISSPLIIDLLLLEQPPAAMVATVQAEVAQRMMAGPDQGKIYGTLGVMMQCAGQVQIVRKLGPQAFWPQPNVHSAMIKWQRTPTGLNRQHLLQIKQTIEALLSHRRKTIGGVISRHPRKQEIVHKLTAMGLSPDLRAEKLTALQFAELASENFFAAAE